MRELLTEKFEKPSEISLVGKIIWRNRFGQIHRENDLPAKIYPNISHKQSETSEFFTIMRYIVIDCKIAVFY